MNLSFCVLCASSRVSHVLRIKSTRSFVAECNLLRFSCTMPPEKLHFYQARSNYEKKKLKKNLFPSSILNVKVVGSGAHGAPRSVYILTERARYLFNCGEGTQRISSEVKLKISRMQHIFVTYPSWENIGGLIGMGLTVQAIGIPELFIHGHPSIENVYSATNKFVALKTTKISMMDCDTNNDFVDEDVSVKYVKLYSTASSDLNKNFSESNILNLQKEKSPISSSSGGEETEEDDVDYYEYLNDETVKSGKKKKGKSKKNKRSQSEVRKANSTGQEKYALSFILKTACTPGTLHPEKCVELGIRPGPLFGKLKKGEDVVLKDGTVIKSTDVKDPDYPGCTIIIVECPSEDYLDALLKEPAFSRHQEGQRNLDELATLVIHFSSSKILKHPKYEEWFSRFSKETKHLFINEENHSVGPLNTYQMQHQLNLIDPNIFPLLFPPPSAMPEIGENGAESPYLTVESTLDSDFKNDKTFYKFNKSNVLKGETFCEVYLRPIKNYDFSYSFEVEPQKYVKEAMETEGFIEALKKFKEMFKDMKDDILKNDQVYPKILFLGTGSSQPFKHRNTSGILVYLDEKNVALFDCGEGTYTQIVRFFGKEGAKQLLRDLNFIYVSHMHADHHLGLITLLRERRRAFEEIGGYVVTGTDSTSPSSEKSNTKFTPLYLLSPMPLTRWLNLFSKELEDISNLYDLIPNSHLCNKSFLLDKKVDCKEKANLSRIRTTLVDHCPNAYGVSITHKDGWKLTYSGDTKPCAKLVELGKNSDILIHEATLSDGMEKDAAFKLHSTTKQAVSVGEQMNAKFILLTHFSQRFSHLPLLNENFKENTGIAFDNMMVPRNHLPLLPKLYDPLKTLFLEQYEKMEGTHKLKLLNRMKRRASVQQEDYTTPLKQLKKSVEN